MQHPYLDLNPHPILHLDAQGGCLYANPPGARLWKALSSDAEGLPPSWVTRVRTAMETGTPQNTLITAGGRIYTLHIVSHPQGEGVLCFGFETTELTQNTRRSIFQANLGRLISQISSRFINLEPQNLSAGITQVLHDLGEFLRARRAYIFQRDKTGRTFHNTHAWHTPQVQSLQETWQNLALSDYPYWWQALEKGTPILVPSVHNLPPEAQNEARALEKRGAHAAIAIPLAAHGHLLGFLGFDDPAEVQVWNPQAIEQLKTCAEIIASAILRQRSESALRNQRDFALLVMRTMGQGLTVTDPAGRMRYVNPAFARLLGYTPEALLNRPATSLVADDDLPTYQQALEQRRHGESTTYEITLKRKDGTRCPVLVTSVPYRRNNQIAGSIAVITDLSERKEVEALLRTQNQELERTRDQALEAARLKSEFLATMSHEIRTPMNSIIGMAELLLETNLDAQQKEFTTTIYQSTQALLDIVNDILDFSKIEAGELRLENAPFNPSALVEDIAETFSIQARQKSLSLMTFISPDVPSTLVGDERHLRRVLTSLVDNAVKFTEEGEINIQVQVISRDAHHTTLEYSVQDTGIGIPEALHRRIFQPFTQADGSLSRQYGGTGLGLAICKQIVEKMGGKIAFQSTAGKGTRFWFQVPLANAHSIEEEPPSPSTLTLEGKRILLVEDSHASRNIIRQYLENWG
ncbi:MAG: PAS domain S-box protein, partial [Anaerolineae bacterium]